MQFLALLTVKAIRISNVYYWPKVNKKPIFDKELDVNSLTIRTDLTEHCNDVSDTDFPTFMHGQILGALSLYRYKERFY